MGHLVDFILEVMEDISEKPPVLFQRDGVLYAASGEGFGAVSYGLSTEPLKIESWEKKKQLPEIELSTQALVKWDGKRNEPVWAAGEKKYFSAITHSPDGTLFSLDDMAKTATDLGKLPYDGKIRLIRHDSRHHSHKHGYAMDGTDVRPKAGRTMDKENYLRLAREKESELLAGFQKAGDAPSQRSMVQFYETLRAPSCMILTPAMRLTVPDDRTLKLYRDDAFSSMHLWNYRTMIHGHFSDFKVPSFYNKDADVFNVNVTTNSASFEAITQKELVSASQKTLADLNKQLAVVASKMSIAQPIVTNLNKLHRDNKKKYEKLPSEIRPVQVY